MTSQLSAAPRMDSASELAQPSSAAADPNCWPVLLDPIRAEAARKALATRGFDRVRVFMELADAFRYVHELGYRGPKEGAEAFLLQVIESQPVTASLACPSIDSKRAGDTSLPAGPLDDAELRSPEKPKIGPVRLEAKPKLATELAGSVLNLSSVADLLAVSEISVRLANVAAQTALFHEWAAVQAVARRPEFLALTLRLKNAGRKTVKEIDALLERYALGRRVAEGFSAYERAGDVPIGPLIADFGLALPSPYDRLTVGAALRDRDELLYTIANAPEVLGLLDGFLDVPAAPPEPSVQKDTPPLPQEYLVPIVELLEDQVLSKRLENILHAPTVRALRLVDFVNDRSRFDATILDLQNAGSKTLDEIVAVLSSHIEQLDGVAMREDKQGQGESPKERLLLAMSSMPEKQQNVLRWRYGLDGQPPRTLQDIATDVHVSRERVRQVEKKALDRLTRVPGRKSLSALIDTEQEQQWALLVGEAASLSQDEVSQRSRLLDPLFAMALDAQFGGIRNWLESFAYCSGGSWFRSPEDAARIGDLATSVERLARTLPTPTPLERIELILGRPVGEALENFAGQDWSVFEGYLCAGFVGPRVKRTVRLHAIARQVATGSVLDLGTLILAYSRCHPDDDVSSRVIQMEVQDNPHLFAPMFDGMWIVLPLNRPNSLAAPPFEQATLCRREFADGSIGETIHRLLDEAGPQRISAIISAVARGGISKSSVGAILGSHACFRRVAPGYFGLYKSPAELASLRPSLLNESQCRLFCLARYSGAPSGYYPAWGAGYEMDLVEWSRKHASPELFRSLLSVIKPEDWPVDKSCVSEICAAAKQEARWLIGTERRFPLGRRFIDAAEMLPALAHLVHFGSIGFFALNRISGAVLNQIDAADILAFFVLAGLAEPADDWQGSHSASPAAFQLYELAARRQYETGALSWDDGVLGPVLKSLRRPANEVGWIPADEAAAAIPLWQSGTLRNGRAWSSPNSAPDAEGTFASDEWEGLFGQPD